MPDRTIARVVDTAVQPRQDSSSQTPTYTPTVTLGDTIKAATSDRQAETLAVGTQSMTTIVPCIDGTARPEVFRPVEAAKSTTEVDDIVLRVPPLRSGTSNLGRRADRALVIALLAPPALIALLMTIGVQFALAVCVMFAFVFVITTSMDAMWMWRRHMDREDH
jgi:hypothetical protein